jgi:cell division septal protein FtsQ
MVLFSKKQNDSPRRRQNAGIVERPSEGELEQRYAFKRNRTLTGSASSHVISTGESKAQLKSSRVQAHDLTRQRRHIGGLLMLVIIGSILLYSLIAQFTARVVVKTDDSSVVLDNTYEKAIQAYLSQQPAERLRFLLNVDHLNEYLQTVTPEVKTVNSVAMAGLGVSSFEVTMRAPIAGWNINGKQQFVDDSGTSFDRNYYPTPSVQIIDKSGIQVAAGQAVASNSFLGFVGQVVGLAKSNGYIVTQVVIPSGTTRQIELSLKDVKYPIKFAVDRPAGEQIQDMVAGVNWMAAHQVNPAYLDVRISGRAFFR